MFLKAKQDPEGNKIEAYLDIINLDESKEKVWSYKFYQEICLMYLQFEEHNKFPIYYKKLMEIGRTIDFEYLRPPVESSITLFLNEIFSHCNASVNHWLEDLTEGFNRFEKDKVINMLEAIINLKLLILSKGGKHFYNYKVLNKEEKNIINLVPRMLDYIRDREELERLSSEYFIKVCRCDPKYLDKKRNTILYYNPSGNKRGGKIMQFLSVGWALEKK